MLEGTDWFDIALGLNNVSMVDRKMLDEKYAQMNALLEGK